MTTSIKINGTPTEVPEGAIAYKYADPTDDGRWLYDTAEAHEIKRIDPSLVVMVEG